LTEKRAYEAQLNEETKLRLERIKTASLELPSSPARTPTPETPDKPVFSKRSILLNYLTLGYLPVKVKNPSKSQ